MHLVASKAAERPVIRIDADVHHAIALAADAIGSHAEVFQRDGKLVQVIRAPAIDMMVSPGSPIVRAIPLPTAREIVSTVAAFEKFDARSKKYVRCAPTDAVVAGVLHRAQWPTVRPLVGVLEAPSLRPDGSVIQGGAHYDSATGYLYEPSEAFPLIDDQPTQADAREALKEIDDIFADFPFVNRAARAVAPALFLTIIARPAIVGCTPAFIFDANVRGAGKSLTADAVGMAATGRATAKMSYPSDDVELEKVLASYAMRASALVNFDNIVRPFGGGPLDRCLTATDAVELRVLGKSEIQTLRWGTVIVGSGNNVTLTGDTARRTTVARIESPLENPEDRTGFRYPNLLEHVRARRARLIRAALVILRAWHVAGRSRMGCPAWGSFDAWAAIVPPAIVFAGGADPMQARPAVQGEEDVEKGALIVLLACWGRLATQQGLSARSAIERLYASRREGPPDGFDDLREAIETLVPTTPGKPPSASRLGYQLRRFKGRVVGGRSLDLVKDRTGIARWFVRGAGDAWDAGLIPHTPCERSNDDLRGTSGEHTPHHQHPQRGQVGNGGAK